MARLSFAIALNLITDGFKRGTQDVKSGMASIKSAAMSTAAYFGIGFAGVGAIFSKLKDAAVDFAKAQKQLNVNSGGAIAGMQNLQMLKKVAKDTGQEITSLMSTYAKFTATATANGYAVSEQQKIFQNVSKAVKAYKLSDEEQATVMSSLNRMMNQGQVSTKNFTNTMLRAMPQAKTAMAAALGVGVDKLTAVIKKGADAKKVLSTFAENLGKQAPTVDLNTLSGQQARRQNAFTDLANSSGVVNALKNVNKVAADVMEYIRNNAKNLITEIVGLIAGIKIASFWNQWKTYSEASSAAMISNATKAHTQIRLLERQTTVLKKQITTQEAALTSASADERLAIEVQLQAKKEALAVKEENLVKAKNVAVVADERAAAVQSGTAWGSAWAKIQTGAETLGTRLKAVWSTIGPMLLMTVITELAMRLYAVFQQLQSVRKEWDEYKKGAREATHTQEISQLENMRNLVTQRGASEEQVRSVMDDINNRYGAHIKNEKQLIAWINKRAEALKNTALAEYYTRKQVEYQSKLDDIYARHGGSQKGLDKDQKTQGGTVKDLFKYMTGWVTGSHSVVTDYKDAAKLSQQAAKAQKDAQKYVGLSVSTQEKMSYSGYSGEQGKIKKDPAETELESAERQYAKSLREINAKEKLGMITATEATKARQELVVSTYAQVETSKYAKVRGSKFATNLKSEYSDIQNNRAYTQLNDYSEDFNKKVKDLGAQYASSAITQDEYKKAVMDLVTTARKDIAAFNNIPGTNEAYKQAVMSFATGLTTMEQPLTYGKPKDYVRDSTYDYRIKKEDKPTEIMSGELDKAKDKLEALKSGSLKEAGSMIDNINAQLAKVTSLKDALKLEEVKKDVKQFAKDLQSQTWSSIKSIMDGSDQIVSSWQQLGQTLNNADATGWEKIMAIWHALESSVDGIISIIDAIKSWTEASEDLAAAKQALTIVSTTSDAETAGSATTAAAVETMSLGERQVANEGLAVSKEAAATVSMAADAETTTSATAAAAVETGLVIAQQAENHTAVAGNMAVAGSEVVKQNAKIPWVGIGLAAVGLAAIMALLGALPKFATGGIIGGGSTSGDNMLARVNSGEMILNGGQQKNLFNAINSGGLGGTTQVSLTSSKVRGSDMYLAIDNYMRSHNKKWSR